MLLFAAGTTPVLFLLGSGAAWIKKSRSFVFQRALGMMIIIFSIYTFNTGWIIKDLPASRQKSAIVSQPENNHPDKIEEKTTQTQTVTMAVTTKGFEPRSIPLKKDVPVKWIINGENITSCTNEIVVPSLEISKTIQKGINVLEFTPTTSGKIAFSCWMGMVRGEFVVQ